MSYCRWSSEDFNCDIYCYRSSEGYMIHVANYRLRGEPPLGDIKAFEKWIEDHQKTEIGLPSDGKTFVEPNPASAAQRLLSLREEGYIMPQYAIDRLLEEAI